MAVSTIEACPVRAAHASANGAVALTAPLTPGRARPASARAPARAAAASVGMLDTNRAWGGVCIATPNTRPSPSSTVAQRWSSLGGRAPATMRLATTATTLVLRGSERKKLSAAMRKRWAVSWNLARMTHSAASGHRARRICCLAVQSSEGPSTTPRAHSRPP